MEPNRVKRIPYGKLHNNYGTSTVRLANSASIWYKILILFFSKQNVSALDFFFFTVGILLIRVTSSSKVSFVIGTEKFCTALVGLVYEVSKRLENKMAFK